METTTVRGPLAGVRVVEIAGLGATPFAAMMLADLGADVIRIDRPGGAAVVAVAERFDVLNRSRPSVALDLKQPAAIDAALELISRADVLLEGLRPGVMERLGLGPEICQGRNERLVYARMTGWGQSGPLAARAGHDINYIAQAGALHLLGQAGAPPAPPINFLGDFGGGAMFVVTGILAALIERTGSGQGQVIDAAMIDGAALLTAQICGFTAAKFWSNEREDNLLDGGCYFYRTYTTADDKYLAVGAIEPQFHSAFLAGLGLDLKDFPAHLDRRCWAERACIIADVIRRRTRDEWLRRFESLDACVSPVLTPAEAAIDPANRARGVFIEVDAVMQPAPAPRFSRTPAAVHAAPGDIGEGGEQALTAWGFSKAAISALIDSGAMTPGAQAPPS